MSDRPPSASQGRVEKILFCMSPSAPYDLRQTAMGRAKGSVKWWDIYPEGVAAAAIFRILRLIGNPGWEVKGDELPDV